MPTTSSVSELIWMCFTFPYSMPSLSMTFFHLKSSALICLRSNSIRVAMDWTCQVSLLKKVSEFSIQSVKFFRTVYFLCIFQKERSRQYWSLREEKQVKNIQWRQEWYFTMENSISLEETQIVIG